MGILVPHDAVRSKHFARAIVTADVFFARQLLDEPGCVRFLNRIDRTTGYGDQTHAQSLIGLAMAEVGAFRVRRNDLGADRIEEIADLVTIAKYGWRRVTSADGYSVGELFQGPDGRVIKATYDGKMNPLAPSYVRPGISPATSIPA